MRAVLEAIAFGDDPEVRPSDRLRALDLLAEQRDEDLSLEDLIRRDVARLSDEDLDAWLDALLVAEFSSGVPAGRFPELAGLLEREVERRAAEIADPKRIETEIAERAETRARELYESRAFTVVESESLDDAGHDDDHGGGDGDDDPQFEVFRRVTGDD
jgi:hypothetical protein